MSEFQKRLWFVAVCVLTLVGAERALTEFETYRLYVDSGDTSVARLTLVKRTWWGFRAEDFAVVNTDTATGRAWMYYKPQPLGSASSAKPKLFPLPHRVTYQGLEDSRQSDE